MSIHKVSNMYLILKVHYFIQFLHTSFKVSKPRFSEVELPDVTQLKSLIAATRNQDPKTHVFSNLKILTPMKFFLV